MRDALLVLVVILCSLGALTLPAFGFLSFVFFSIFNPHSFAWSFGRTFPFAQCLGLATLLGYVLWFRPKRLPLRKESIILLALWAHFAVTTMDANYPDLATVALERVSKVLLMVFLSMSLLNTRTSLHWLMRVIAVALGLHALRGGGFFILTGGSQLVYGPEDSFLEGNNSFGLALAMNVPLLHHLARMEPRRWFRRTLWTMLAFTIPATLGTYSRGAWLGLAAGLGLLVLRSKRKYLGLSLAAVACILALPFLPEKIHSRYQDLRNYREESSAQTRLWTWEFALRVGLAHPTLGAGFDYYGIEAYARYYPEFLERWPGKVWSCHSVWLTLFSEHGFPGFCLFVLLLLSSLRSLRQLKTLSRKGPQHAWILPYVLMLEGSLAVFVVSGTFFDAAYFDLFYQLVAAIVILKELNSSTVRKVTRSKLALRASRRLSMLPEILFALSRHWFLILLLASLGATVLLDVASKRPAIYVGKATLLFPKDELIVGPAVEERRPAEERPLSAQVQMLRSDSVARKVVQAFKDSGAPQPPGPRETIEEQQLQRAVASFRARSEVVPNPLTRTVEIRVRGSSRDLVGRELREWINAFVARLTEITGESRDAFLGSRTQYWGDLERHAREALDAFRRENPDATNANRNLALQELAQLQLLQLALERRLNLGRDPESRNEPEPGEDPERQSLLARRRIIEEELTQALPLYSDGSEKVRGLQQSMELVESMLAALELERRESAVNGIEKAKEAVSDARKRYAAVSEKCEKLQGLEETLLMYERAHRSYEILDMESKDKEELSRSVQVQVSDKPLVSWLPARASRLRYGSLGALAGLVIGALLSVLREVTAGKLRFKHDVQGEFGLPVVGVIPRR